MKIVFNYSFAEDAKITDENVKDFIDTNKPKLRTEVELLWRLEAVKSNDFMWSKTEIISSFLSFDKAKHLFKQEYIDKVESWESEYTYKKTIDECVKYFLWYLQFAWWKSLDERWLSAGRSIEKLWELLYIMSFDELSELINNDSLYNPYWMPALIEVSQKLWIEVPEECLAFAWKKVHY